MLTLVFRVKEDQDRGRKLLKIGDYIPVNMAPNPRITKCLLTLP